MRSIPLWAALALLLGLATAKASTGSGSGSSSSSMWQRALFARNSRNLRHHSGPAAITSSSGDPSSDVGLGAFDVFANNNNNNNEYGQLFAPYALEQQPQQQQQPQQLQPQHQQVSASDGREGERVERAESKKQLSRRSAAAQARGKLHLWLLCENSLKYEKRENMFKIN